MWTGTSFSGMPAYQTGLKSESNLIQYVHKIIHLGLPRPIDIIFMYLLGFYFLLISLKVDYRLSIIGSIGFAFSSYFFIIIQAGHMTKAHAISYLPLIIAAVIYTYRNNRWVLGAACTSLFLALQLYANHYQITYYTIFILFFIGVFQFIKDLKGKNLINFSKRSVVLVLAGILALGTNYTRISTTMEYSSLSQRGKSELNNRDQTKKDRGWGFDYITEYSYGKLEPMTFLIPNFMGGISGSRTYIEDNELKLDSKTYKSLGNISDPSLQEDLSRRAQSYWGEQSNTQPTYVGSIIIFLFVLGLLYVRSDHKMWIIITTILSILLALGHNFPEFSRFFINYIPAYGKFRAITMILIIAQFGIALLAILALNRFLNQEDSGEKEKKLKFSFYIVGGLTLILSIAPGIFLDFLSLKDKSITDQQFLHALISDRAAILQSDAFRSFIYILLSAITLWFFIKRKLRRQFVIIIIGILILVDMWNVNKRYLNDSHFKNQLELSQLGLSLNDDKIVFIPKDGIDDKIRLNNHNNSRVYLEGGSAFGESRTSYFHRSIGGYSSAKIKRYQELYDIYIYPTKDSIIDNREYTFPLPNPHKNKILGMLNCGWVINNNKAVNSKNYGIDSLGNAWFVNDFRSVSNVDDEFNSLSDSNINLKNTVIIHQDDSKLLSDFDYNPDARIMLKTDEYKPNHLIYSLENITTDHLAVFSEIFYEKGWNAYIDGKRVPHFRGNYILRAMIIPEGTERIEFKFQPSSYYTGERVAMASSILLLLLLGFLSYKEFRYLR